MKVKMSTNPVKITPGQSCSVDSNLNVQGPNNDPEAPQDEFLFKSDPGASAVVFDRVNYGNTSVYMSTDQSSSGSLSLSPKPRCKVWFSRKCETSAMVSDFWGVTEPIELDLTGQERKQIWYRDHGGWSRNRW